LRIYIIINFEKHIQQNGIIILKFFLHLSKKEQGERLLRRLDKPKHNWKFSPGDLKERSHWEDYQKYYEEAINRTSKSGSPWYIIPADNKETARVLVAKTILKEVSKYTDIVYPELSEAIKKDLPFYKEQLKEEK